MACTHDVVYGGLCALCGADVESDVQTINQSTTQSISASAIQAQLHALFDPHDPDELQTQAVQQIHPSIVHTVNPNNQTTASSTKPSASQPVNQPNDASHRALVVGTRTIHLTNEAFNTQIASNSKRLINQHKLLLVLDLDHTLLHTTDDPRVGNVMPALDGSDTFAFTLPLPANQINNQQINPSIIQSRRPQSVQHHFVKLRPHTRHFLSSLSDLFDLTVYTMGSRPYAESVMAYLDPDRSLTKNRVCTRSETTDISFKALERLYACDSSLCGIVDDRVDVWRDKQSNVCRVWEFRYWGTHDVYDRNKQHQSGDTPEPQSNSQSLKQPIIQSNNQSTATQSAPQTQQSIIPSTPQASESATDQSPSTPTKQTIKASSNLATPPSDQPSLASDEQNATSKPLDPVPTSSTESDQLVSPTNKQSNSQSLKSLISKTSPTSSSPNKLPVRRRTIPRKPVPLWNETSKPADAPPAAPTDQSANGSSVDIDTVKPAAETVRSDVNSPVDPVQMSDSSVTSDASEEKSTSLDRPASPVQTDSPSKSPSDSPSKSLPGKSSQSVAKTLPSPPRADVRASPPPIDPSTVVLPAHADPKHGDNVLLSLLSVLKAAHTLFFNQPGIKQNNDPAKNQCPRLPLASEISLPSVFARIRRTVLRDCHVVFTGMIPSHVKAADHDIGLLAKQFGASVYESMDDDGFAVIDPPANKPIAITHVVAWREGSSKVKIAQQLRSARAADSAAIKPAPFVVTLSWLYHSVTHYQRAREVHHPVSMAKQSSFDERNRGVVDARYVHHAPRIITSQQILEQVKQFESVDNDMTSVNEAIKQSGDHYPDDSSSTTLVAAPVPVDAVAAAPRTSTIKRKKAKPPVEQTDQHSKRIKT